MALPSSLSSSSAVAATTTTAAAAAPLDFAALLSRGRDNRPSRLAQINVSEKAGEHLKRDPKLVKDDDDEDSSSSSSEEDEKQPSDNHAVTDDDDPNAAAAAAAEKMKKKKMKKKKKKKSVPKPKDQHHKKLLHDLAQAGNLDDVEQGKTADAAKLAQDQKLWKEQLEESTDRLVLQLVSKTPTYTKHAVASAQDQYNALNKDKKQRDKNNNIKSLEDYFLTKPKNYIEFDNQDDTLFSPSFHQVELGDWESKIQWGGYHQPTMKIEEVPDAGTATTATTPTAATAAGSVAQTTSVAAAASGAAATATAGSAANNTATKPTDASTVAAAAAAKGTTTTNASATSKDPTTANSAANTVPLSASTVKADNSNNKNDTNNSNAKSNNTNHDHEEPLFNAQALLQKRRNPFLEALALDDTLISWSGDRQDTLQKAKAVPLILELGVAGQSIARHVLPSHRPMPCVKSDEYQQRMEADWGNGDIISAAELTAKGSLHNDKEAMEKLIAQRQEKRRQMAKDKTNRVTEAMGTLSVLGSGRGRTITSSLMGPGGTEPTGRPSRQIGNAAHDTEYVEQLDMVTNHVLVRDLSRVTLRQYHRPKLPLTVVRMSLIWQFCVRPSGNTSKNKGSNNNQGGQASQQGGSGADGAAASSTSYQAMMMGTHAGAISKAKLRSEADLTPTEGTLVLFEYCEERPPIPLTKGMASKIVTYYRGDKSRCPVSAGGGDRPTRRKRAGAELAEQKDEANNPNSSNAAQTNKVEKPPRLVGPNHAMGTTLQDWVGKVPKKTRDDRKNGEKADKIDILPEGVTEILHPKVHGPFIGEIEDEQAVTGLINNLFVAPLFRHEPESTDFLMILGRNAGASLPGRHETLGVVLRELPSSMFTVGQTEPRARVFAPNTQGEKNFIGPFVSYQIAKALARSEAREGHGLRFDEIQQAVLPNLGLAGNALRQRLKHVAIYDKNTSIWTTKAIGYEDYPGVDALGKQIAPEGVAAYEVAAAAVRRLSDLGIHQLYSGSHAVGSVGVTMVYLAGQVNATRELARKMNKLVDYSRSSKAFDPVQVKYYEQAAVELEAMSKALRQRHEVAKFIYEELQLAPWNLTGEFIDVHKKGEGTGMMKLTGLGDPSGIQEGFSFIRAVDTKPSKSVVQQTEQMKKITGTEDDLRKLTMKQMASLLRSYGMKQKQIDTLKRWDRVHVIRDLSTKAASDGIGDGLERFARGEKMKLAEQKEEYRRRIQVIWKRQMNALSADFGGQGAGAVDGGGAAASEADMAAAARPAAQKKDEAGKDDSDDESEDDDFAEEMEEEMMDRPEANMLVAAQAGTGGDASLGQLRNAAQDQDMSKDARELAQLKRQREEERAARESAAATVKKPAQVPITNRKIIRKRIIKTYPDGRQTTTFKFILHPDEVGQIIDRLNSQRDDERRPRRNERPEYPPDEKHVGHGFFEDDDDFEFSTRGRGGGVKRRGGGRGRARPGARALPRKKDLQFGKLKTKVTKEQRIKKRKRDEEEAELYAPVAKRKGTSNRKERGAIRDRKPHVIMADRLESIRSHVESRPTSGPFHKRVNQRAYPQYYEVISHPIDLATIRDKIQKYEYRKVDAFLKDFALMKSNAIKFNGVGQPIAEEGAAIYQVVKDLVEENRGELTHLEDLVAEQMNSTKPKKRRKKGSPKSASSPGAGIDEELGNLGDINIELDSDSD